MEITEIKVKVVQKGDDKLLAFASVTFDNSFVVRDIKIISGAKGLFIAMPSRKMTGRCPRCGCKNHLRASYRNDCGNKLPPVRGDLDERGRAKLHADIAHPINSRCRQSIQQAIMKAYRDETEAAKHDGYVPAETSTDAGPEGENYDEELPASLEQRAGN